MEKMTMALGLGKPKEGIPGGEKSLMRGVRLTLNECHRNWRFYKLWLLIGLSFAILAMSTLSRLPQESVVTTRRGGKMN